MGISDLVSYYTNLLIIQYKGQPNATAMIAAVVTPALMDQLPTQVMNAYTLGSAVGVQLDVIGKYVGVTRYGTGTNGAITLNDSDFLKLINLAIITNSAGSSLGTIESLLFFYFGSEILISDSASMQINYSIASSFGTSNLQNLIIANNFLPKPMGVQISITIIPPGVNNYFCFSTYSSPAPANTSPFNTYAFYNLTYPWITY